MADKLCPHREQEGAALNRNVVKVDTVAGIQDLVVKRNAKHSVPIVAQDVARSLPDCNRSRLPTVVSRLGRPVLSHPRISIPPRRNC